MFELKLSPIDYDPHITYAMGTVEIHSYDYVTKSDVGTFIFHYISQLLDGLRNLLQNPYVQICSFPMMENSFDFYLKWRYKKPQTILFFHKGKMINEHPTQDVVEAFRHETSRFVNLHSDKLNYENEGVKQVFDSMTAFAQFTYP